MENQNANAKKSSKGLIIGVAAAVVVIAAAALLYIFNPFTSGSVATVDNLKISKQEYTFFTKFNMSSFLSGNQINTEAKKYNWKTKVGSETAKDQVRKSTLEQIQELKIQIIKAKEAGIKLLKEDLDQIDSEILQQYQTQAAAEEAIKEGYGITLQEFKQIYQDLTLAQKYQSSEGTKAKVTDDEVKKYYDENKKEFDKVTVVHVLVSTLDSNKAPVSEGKKAEAKKKAEDILAKVKAGADIKQLALEFSDDKPGVTENKGEYTFGRGEMVSQFEEWSFKDHKAGDADIVETQFGYHIIQFKKREVTALETLKEQLKNYLQKQKASEEFSKNLEAWKKEARFAIKTDDSAIAKVDKTLYGA